MPNRNYLSLLTSVKENSKNSLNKFLLNDSASFKIFLPISDVEFFLLTFKSKNKLVSGKSSARKNSVRSSNIEQTSPLLATPALYSHKKSFLMRFTEKRKSLNLLERNVTSGFFRKNFSLSLQTASSKDTSNPTTPILSNPIFLISCVSSI